jgi:hypothetical protein
VPPKLCLGEGGITKGARGQGLNPDSNGTGTAWRKGPST